MGKNLLTRGECDAEGEEAFSQRRESFTLILLDDRHDWYTVALVFVYSSVQFILSLRYNWLFENISDVQPQRRFADGSEICSYAALKWRKALSERLRWRWWRLKAPPRGFVIM